MTGSDLVTVEGEAAMVVALAAGATQVEAAGRAGVSERTVRRRWADASFRQRVESAQAELVTEALRLERAKILELVRDRLPSVLEEILDGAETSSMTKLKALEFLVGRLDRAERAVAGRDVLAQIFARLERLEVDTDSVAA